MWRRTASGETFPVFFHKGFFGFSLSNGDVPEYFYEFCRILIPYGLVTTQTTGENTKKCYITNSLISYSLSNCFFFFLTSVSHDPSSNTLCDYFSCLQVSLALYTLNMRGESKKRNQQAFFLFEMRDNE